MAETVQQLLAGLQLLGQLQPFTITLAKGMSMPAASWPGGITVGHAVVLAGLPPPAPRTILDLYQVRRGGAGLPVYSVPVFAVTRSSPMLAFVCVVTWCVAHPGPPAVCMRCLLPGGSRVVVRWFNGFHHPSPKLSTPLWLGCLG